jgi:cytoplasmic tRNA 2-thiolation protein 1
MTHSYGLDLFLLSVDEGIAGYRDDSLATVKRNEQTYGARRLCKG